MPTLSDCIKTHGLEGRPKTALLRGAKNHMGKGYNPLAKPTGKVKEKLVGFMEREIEGLESERIRIYNQIVKQGAKDAERDGRQAEKAGTKKVAGGQKKTKPVHLRGDEEGRVGAKKGETVAPVKTKKEKSLEKYNKFIDGLTDEQNQIAGNLIIENPKSPGLQILRIGKALKGKKVKVKTQGVGAEIKRKKTRPSRVTTIRGRIKKMGGINFLNYTGELKELPLAVKYLSNKKTGMPIDTVVMNLKEEGWLGPDETVATFLESLRDPNVLKRGKFTDLDKGGRKKGMTEEQKALLQEERDYEEPPPGDYVTMKAEDLPKGKELTIIDGSSKEGWDTYKVKDKDPFEITLEDGEIVKLRPLDKVDVLKKDLTEKETEKGEPEKAKEPGEFDPLKILFAETEPVSEAEKSQAKTPSISIDKQIASLQGEISDWQSRKYKRGKKVVAAGGTKDDLNATLTTTGAANERRRTRNIEIRQKAVLELESAKERISAGEDPVSVYSEMLDSSSLHVVDFAERQLKDYPDLAKPAEVTPTVKRKEQLGLFKGELVRDPYLKPKDRQQSLFGDEPAAQQKKPVEQVEKEGLPLQEGQKSVFEKEPPAEFEIESQAKRAKEQYAGWKGFKKPATEKKETDKIEDFGEKLGGARKDYYAEFTSKLKASKELDIASDPFSKTWPEPKYGKLIEDGADPWIIGFVRAARDEIPNKPRKSWKLRTWIGQVKMLRGFAVDLIDGKIAKKTIQETLEQKEFATIKKAVGGRADLYEIFGHDKSLKGIRIAEHFFNLYKGEKDVNKWIIEKDRKATAFSNMPYELGVGNTRKEAIEQFRKKYESLGKEPKRKTKGVKFHLYRKTGEKGVIIGKKIGKNYADMKRFDTTKEAREYLKNNQAELEEKLRKYKTVPGERREVNRERIGVSHRQGKDATSEMFQDAFGFRGVEFGNWVNTEERQDNLNRGYDALMDLSTILNIPPKAISLNGELGLGFGSRGRGGKNAPAAHFEPDKVVINLTRKNGPGSLAHEFWHAIDNHFSRRRGKKLGYVTEGMRPGNVAHIRKEVMDAFDKIMSTIIATKLPKRSAELDKRRTKPYWKTEREMAARAFESYVIERLSEANGVNDYLANIKGAEGYATEMVEGLLSDDLTAMDMYPYLLKTEIKPVRDAFDSLFNTLETEETDKGVKLYQLDKQPRYMVSKEHDTTTNIEKQRSLGATGQSAVKRLEQSLIADHPQRLKGLILKEVPAIVSKRLAVKRVGKLFGIETRFIKGNRFLGFSGVVTSDSPNTVFINVESPNPALAILGHEVLHSLDLKHPDLYNHLVNGIKSYTVGQRNYLNKLRQQYENVGIELPKDDLLTQEFYADFLGDQFADKNFWDFLNGKSPTLTKRLIRFIQKAISKIKSAFRQFDSSAHFKNLREVQKITADVMAEFSAREGKAKTEINQFAQPKSYSLTEAIKRIWQNLNFKKWFGEGAIKDVLYHGTIVDDDFSIFKPGDSITIARSLGVHLAKDPSVSQTFAMGDYTLPSDFAISRSDPETKSWYRDDSGKIRFDGILVLQNYKNRNVRPYNKTKDGPIYTIIDKGDEAVRIAKPKGRIIPVVTNIKNPLVVNVKENDMDDFKVAAEIGKIVFPMDKQLFIDSVTWNIGYKKDVAAEMWDDLKRGEKTKTPAHNYKSFDKFSEDHSAALNSMDRDRIISLLEKAGYDGVQYRNTSTNEVREGADPTSYIIFRPTQIKSIYNQGTFDPKDPDIRHQAKEPGAVWYSQMEDYFSEKLPNKGTPKSYAQTINSWAKKGLIKQEELEWSGLNEWLSARQGKVTKQEVLDYLADNNVGVEEVVKGGKLEMPESYNMAKRALESLGYEVDGDTIRKNNRLIELPSDAGEDAGLVQALYDASDLPMRQADTKFSQYRTPGGENYREVLLTLPVAGVSQEFSLDDAAKEKFGKSYNELSVDEKSIASMYRRTKSDKVIVPDEYTGPHYDEPNVLAHVRFDERTDVDGKRVLFLDEIQADKGQEWRKLKKLIKEGKASEQEKKRFKFLDENFPFNKTSQWSLLAIKRMVRWAAENGFEKIAWTTGEMQADRYDLSKQVQSIKTTRRKDGSYVLYITDKSGHKDEIPRQGSIPENKLSEYVGKDLAEKIISDTKTAEDPQKIITYSGLDLKVGGEGMKAFYDKIIPATINKFFNKAAWGKARVGATKIETEGGSGEYIASYGGADVGKVFSTKAKAWNELREEAKSQIKEYTDDKVTDATIKQWFEDAEASVREQTAPTVEEVWSLPITDKMQAKAMGEGMPQYQVEAFQGGPHDVTKSPEGRMSTKYIGTGEGAQYFGWGLYFSDLKSIAKDYAEMGRGRQGPYKIHYGGKNVYDKDSTVDDITRSNLASIADLINRGRSNFIAKTQTRSNLERMLRAIDEGKPISTLSKERVLDRLNNIKKIDPAKVSLVKPKDRNLYKVTLHKGKKPGEYTWLDWDKAPSKSTIKKIVSQGRKENKIYRRMEKWVDEDVTPEYTTTGYGEQIYGELSSLFGSQKQASLFLLRAGIDGIRYPAGSLSGMKDRGKKNYVVFDENAITIEEHKRYQIQNVTQAHYDQAYKSKAPIAKPVKGMAAFARGLVKGADKMLGAISSRLERINPELKHKVRKLDFDTAELAKKYGRAIDPLLQKSKKMTARDRFDWDYARKNSDTTKINSLIKKYGLEKEYSAYRKALDGIRSDAYDVGLSMGYIEDYAPRVLRDQRGFLEATGRSPERGIYSEAIRQKARNMGISVADLTTEQKASIVSNFILGGPRGIGKPSFTKKRQIKIIPPKYSKFYMNSDSAVVQYIYSMTKAIEARKFFGKVSEKVARMRKELKSAEKQEKQGELVGTLYAKELRAELERYALQRDFSADISTYITGLLTDGKITEAHEQDLHDILHARFHEHGATGGWQAYKNFSYIDTMGSPISALTQIGDLAWAAHVGGFGAIKHAVRSAFKRSKITKGDLGFDRIAQEFADASSLSNAVSKVFKYVGLEKIDAIGKEALINSAYDKYKKLAEKDPKRLKKEIQAMFGNETTDVITDLRSGDITDNVRLLLYNKVLDFQPMSLSEMPQTYLTAGNGRVFYMLKTFTLKQFDVFRTQAYNKIRYGNKKEKIEGMKNFVSVAALFVLANAAADELKDWLLDRETDLEDRVVDNLLRLAGVSKFVTWKARTEGVGSALARQILPPFKFIDAAGKDILNAGDDKGLEVMSSIPLVGKLYYWHMGRGTSKRGDLWDRRWAKRKKRLKEIKEKYDTSSNRAEYRKKNIAELSEYRRMRMVQKKLNKRRTIINRLKKRNPHLTERIDRLENQRTDLIKRYWERNEIGFLNR